MSVPADLGDLRAGVRAAHHNHRRARAIAALPSVVVFGVVALVLFGLGATVVGLIAGAAAAVALYSAVLLGSTPLLVRSLGARRTDEEDLPRAYNIAEGLCASMGLPMPKIFSVEDQAKRESQLRTLATRLSAPVAQRRAFWAVATQTFWHRTVSASPVPPRRPVRYIPTALSH